jgi:hypothetical protein
MPLFDSHIDRELGPLGGGALSPRRFRRMQQHARSCHRCAALYERSIRVLRQLENQSPFEPAQLELQAFTELNQPRTRSMLPSSSPWVFGALAIAAALTLTFVLRAPPDEFGVRGGVVNPVALRVFCGGQGTALTELTELTESASCSVGQSLALALGAGPSHGQVVVQLSGSAVQPERASSVVTGRPGAEEPVALTAKLERAGEVEVLAAFANDAATAEAAARGERPAGAVVLKRTVKVTP